MKTVALRFNSAELDELVAAFDGHLIDASQNDQRQHGLELLQLWIKLQDAARDAGAYMVEDSLLPKWARGKLREALATAGQVETLKSKVEALESRAKARGVTISAQPPTVSKSRKKPARKSKPKPAAASEVTAPAAGGLTAAHQMINRSHRSAGEKAEAHRALNAAAAPAESR